jgi:hypothetical protein
LCRNFLLKHVIERNIEGRKQMMERRRRRLKQLLDYLTEVRGYWKLAEEALNHGLWKRLWTCCKIVYCHKIAYGANEHKFQCM